MGLVAYYKLDSDVKDYSGNGNHGVNNGVTFDSGKVNNAGVFGITEYVNILGIDEDDLSEEKTHTFWFKTSDITPITYRRMYHRQAGTAYYSMVLLSSGNIEMTCKNDVGSTDYSGFDASLEDDTWYFFELYWDGNGRRIVKINGVEFLDDTHTGSFIGAITIHTIGFNSNGFEGNIDEVRVYDHVLSPLERDRIYNYLGKNEIVVNGKDYSEILIGLSIKDIFAKAAIYKFTLIDPTLLKTASIAYGQELDIYIEGEKKFRGVIFDKPEEAKTGFSSYLAYSKIIYMLDKFINIDYVNKTIDYIIKDIIDLYFNGVFTYNNVVPRTIVYDSIIYNGQSVWYILQDLAKRENLQLRVDEDDDIHLTDLLTNDSGKSYNLDSGLSTRSFDFPDISKTIKNSVLVFSKQLTPDGKGGVAVRYNNLDSIAQYGRKIEHSPITVNDIETEDECYAKGKEIIDEIAFALQDGQLENFFDTDLLPGQLIRITYAKKDFDDKQFLIKSTFHSIKPKFTVLKIAEVDNTTIDLLVSVFNALRKNEERFRDSAAIVSNVIKVLENININMRVTVTRIIAGSRVYDVDTQMDNFSMIAGSALEQNVISEEKMVLTNDGKKKLLDILTGLEIGNELVSAKLWGGLGTGTTSAQITDTDLETEVDINSDSNTKQDMDSGFPARVDDYNVEMQFSVSDSDLASQAFNEIGLFDADSGGIMYSRQVTSTQFNKNPNETLRVKINMEMVDL